MKHFLYIELAWGCNFSDEFMPFPHERINRRLFALFQKCLWAALGPLNKQPDWKYSP